MRCMKMTEDKKIACTMENIRQHGIGPWMDFEAIAENVRNGVYTQQDVDNADRQCKERDAFYRLNEVREKGLYQTWFGYNNGWDRKSLIYGINNGLFTREDVIAADAEYRERDAEEILGVIAEKGIISLEETSRASFADRQKYSTQYIRSDDRTRFFVRKLGKYIREGTVSFDDVLNSEREYRLRDPIYAQRAANVLVSAVTNEPLFNKNVDHATKDELKAMRETGGPAPFNFEQAIELKERFLDAADEIRKEHVKKVLDKDVYKKYPDMSAGEAYKLGLRYGLLTREEIGERVKQYTERFAENAIDSANKGGVEKIAQLKALGRKGFLTQEQINDSAAKIKERLRKDESDFSDFVQTFYR